MLYNLVLKDQDKNVWLDKLVHNLKPGMELQRR